GLTNTTSQMLIGYPTRGVSDAQKGQMFATPLSNYNFTVSSSLSPEVFLSTNFAGLPGASGGPLCVLYNLSNTNAVWFPAGVYLGVTLDGSARVRAIDGPLAALIQQAEDAANASVN